MKNPIVPLLCIVAAVGLTACPRGKTVPVRTTDSLSSIAALPDTVAMTDTIAPPDTVGGYFIPEHLRDALTRPVPGVSAGDWEWYLSCYESAEKLDTLNVDHTAYVMHVPVWNGVNVDSLEVQNFLHYINEFSWYAAEAWDKCFSKFGYLAPEAIFTSYKWVSFGLEDGSRVVREDDYDFYSSWLYHAGRMPIPFSLIDDRHDPETGLIPERVKSYLFR